MGRLDKPRPKKRTFIILLLVTLLMVFGLGYIFYLLPFLNLSEINPILPKVLGWFFLSMFLFAALSIFLLVVTIILEKELLFSKKLRGIMVKWIFPLVVIIGKIIGIPREKVEQSFIEVNNRLVRANLSKRKPKRILILLPHCIQNSKCAFRLTGEEINCRKCGACAIKELLDFSEEFKTEISVATGGTLARRIVVKKKPQALIAVACERDLSSGIQDSYPLPVLGILLDDRPQGPCINTQVDTGLIREALKFLVSGDHI
ncbi:MAG: DUF116 domain-containing protein [Candidatus Tectomicrobia bacterium]|uniref:DUF116 domain-containing protein n=1 Tax=Tectimicrobiota bacterium TaxID=2528274 RepID=A0A933LPI3_UNCTE|nr:DUF116 domain-containing protein [Candidatus Tectomicrobia bacterium]